MKSLQTLMIELKGILTNCFSFCIASETIADGTINQSIGEISAARIDENPLLNKHLLIVPSEVRYT